MIESFSKSFLIPSSGLIKESVIGIVIGSVIKKMRCFFSSLPASLPLSLLFFLPPLPSLSSFQKIFSSVRGITRNKLAE